MSSFTHDELTAAFLEAIEGIEPELERPADAFTTSELAERLGRSPSWVIRYVKRLIKEGRAETVQFQIRNLTGKVINTTGYRLINEEESGGTEIQY